MSAGYQPQPTPAVPTGMHQVIPNRNPSVVGVRETFETAFGGYVPADWTLDAECTLPGTNPETFYPRKGGNRMDQQAKAACAVCIVRAQCLLDALVFEVGEVGAEDVRPEVHGIRGGMGQKERRELVQAIRIGRKPMPTLADLDEPGVA